MSPQEYLEHLRSRSAAAKAEFLDFCSRRYHILHDEYGDAAPLYGEHMDYCRRLWHRHRHKLWRRKLLKKAA